MSHNDKLVSIIIPAFNYGHFISQSLDSVVSQSYRKWECIIVDDGSTDDTREIVDEYCASDRRFRYVYHENSGLSAARNTGIAHCSGSYVQFLDADDLIESEKLRSQVDFLNAHVTIDIIYDHVYYFESSSLEKKRRSRTSEVDWSPPIVRGRGPKVLTILLENNRILVNAPLLRRSVLTSVGDFDIALKAAEDWDYWLRCAAKGFAFEHQSFPNACGCVRNHESSMSADRLRMTCAMAMVRKKISKLTIHQEVLGLSRKYWSDDEGRYGIELTSHGHVALGIWHLLRAAWLSLDIKFRLRWSLCAVLAAFVRGEKFRMLAMQSWSRVAPTLTVR